MKGQWESGRGPQRLQEAARRLVGAAKLGQQPERAVRVGQPPGGQLLAVLPGQGSCLRCLFEGPPPPGALPTCAEAGVASPLCGVVGAAMASEAARVLRGERPHAIARLHQWDALRETERDVPVPRDPRCPACALAPEAALRHP